MTSPYIATNREHAETLAREIIDASQGSQLQEFLIHSLAVPEYLEVNGTNLRRINLGLAGNICYPE